LRIVKENVCVSLQNSVGLFEFYDCLLVNQKLCFLWMKWLGRRDKSFRIKNHFEL